MLHFLSGAPSVLLNSSFFPPHRKLIGPVRRFSRWICTISQSKFHQTSCLPSCSLIMHHPKRDKTAPHCCRWHSSLACAVFRWVRRRKTKIIFFLEVNRAPFQFIKNNLEERKQAVNEAAYLTLLLRLFLLLVSAYVSESNWKLIQWDRLPTLIVQNHKVLFQLKSHRGRKQNWLIMPARKLNCECTFLNGY